MEGKLLLDALLERQSFLKRERVGLGNDGHNIDNVRKLLEDHDVNWLQRVARRLNEEEAAVDTGVLDITLALGRELFPQVRGVLVLDVLDDGVPAPVVVDQITIAGSIHNVQSEADVVLFDDVRHGLNLGGGTNDLIRIESALGLNEVGSEDGINQGRLAQTCLAYNGKTCQLQARATVELRVVPRALTDADDIELETTLQELALDLRGNTVETNVALGVNRGSGHRRHFFCGCEQLARGPLLFQKAAGSGRRELIDLADRGNATGERMRVDWRW